MINSPSACSGNASWIWADERQSPANSFMVFRMVIDHLKSMPRKACPVKISASNIYLLYVNGHYLGRGPVLSWKKHIGIDTHDIRMYLKSGRNVISVLAHNYGVDIGSSQVSRPGFFFRGQIAGLSLSTGVARWECLRPECWSPQSSIISDHCGFNEDVDMAKYHPEAWRQGAPGNQWRQTVVIPDAGKYWPVREQRIIPYLAENLIGGLKLAAIGVYRPAPGNKNTSRSASMAGEKHAQIHAGGYQIIGNPWPLKIKPGVTPYLILDAGRLTSGAVALDITAATAGTNVRIGYDQVLYLNQRPLIEGRTSLAIHPADNFDLRLHPDHGGSNNSVDSLLLKRGANRWESVFNIRGFRYVKLSFSRLKAPLTINSVKCREITYPARPAAEFKCSDPLLNRIWETARLTTRLCLADTFMDNPSRERMQYGNDGYQQALYTHYFFGDTRLWRQLLHMFPQGARPDKAIQSGGPWPWNQIIFACPLLWIESIREYVNHTGDNSVCPELAAGVIDALGWFVQFENKDGLLTIREKFDWGRDVVWNFLDWQGVRGQLKGAAAEVALNCMYAQALATAAWILKNAGQAAAASRCRDKSGKIRVALTDSFDKIKPGTRAEHAVVWATLAGIVRGKMNKIAEAALAGTVKSDVIFLFFTLKALVMEGHTQAALNLIRNIFGQMLKDGSSTFYETIHARQDPTRALCQGIGAVPGYFLPRIITGITGINCREKTATIQPVLSGLDWVEATFPCPGGRIQIKIRQEAKRRKMEARLPDGWKLIKMKK